ncbi:unnamed protein product [Ectocarpus sp. 4 AP-2014]
MVRILFSNDNDNNKGFSSSTGHTWPHPVAPASAMMAMDEERAYGGGEGDMSIVSTARSPASSMKQWEQQQQLLPSDPSTSMFWCAVALGALTQGRPVRSVGCHEMVRNPTCSLVVEPFCDRTGGHAECSNSPSFPPHLWQC